MQYLVPPTELGLSSQNIVVPRYQLKLHAGGQHIEMTKRHGAQEPDELSKVKFPEQDVYPGSQADTLWLVNSRPKRRKSSSCGAESSMSGADHGSLGEGGVTLGT
jgi:hypothetical protein